MGPDLRLLVRGKDINDAVDGLHGRVGVERPEGQVAGFGGGQGGLDGLQVPHLADQHFVGILAEDGFQGGLEGVCIGVQFPLVHHTLFVLMDVLDGVFNGNDVLRLLPVDLVDHGG